MPRLVALDASGDMEFVDALRRAWDAGDAVLPVDPRLPAPAAHRLVSALLAGAPVEPGDALVVATSGTTGEPKGAVLTHAALHAASAATNGVLGVDPARDRWVACLPLAHVGGLGVIVRALHSGTPFDVHDGFDAARVEAAARQGATLVSLVATALRRTDVSGYRRVVLGGAAPPADRPPNVVTTYGMTETCGGVVYDGEPLDGVEVRVDAASGAVSVRGPMLLRCYRDGSDPKSPDGWLATGDVGERDASGRLVVHGRAGDVIVTGGEKVWPDPVEAVLREHAGVADVAVVGRADAEWGARVVAVVVPADRARLPSLDELRALAKEQLPAWAAPKEVEFVSELPKTALGKVKREALRG